MFLLQLQMQTVLISFCWLCLWELLTLFLYRYCPHFHKATDPSIENMAFGKSWWNTEMLVWLCSASKPSSSFFHLKDSEAKGGFRKHVNYPCSSVGPLWAGHHKERSALGEPIRHPSTAILPWTDVLPTVRHRGTEVRGDCQALPLPCHADPGGWVWWATAGAANCIPRLLTHRALSWVVMLNSQLCYYLSVGFAHFLSPGLTVWAAQCESDR